MTSRDVVVVSLEDWDRVWRRNQFLVAGLLQRSADLRVLFVEPAADPLHAALNRTIPHLGRGIQPVNDLAGVCPDRLWRYQPTKFLPRIVSDIDTRIARAVMGAARKLRFHNPLLWVNDPIGAALLTASGWRTMYDITDDWLAADRPGRQLQTLRAHEKLLMERAAEVVVCSPGLVATRSPIRPVNLIRNAVDVEPYRRANPRPLDLPKARSVVYVGTIHRDRIDLDLCREVAERLSAGTGGTLTLVGPAPLAEADLQNLKQAGVLLLGAKDHTEIPGYLQHADVLVVPHVVDDFTDSLDPIKLYEYLASGRPVVSTAVAGFRDDGSPRIHISSRADFTEAVVGQLAAAADDPLPVAFSGQLKSIPNWDDRVTQMAAVLARVEAGKRDSS